MRADAQEVIGVTVQPNASVREHYPRMTATVDAVTAYDDDGFARVVSLTWEDGENSLEELSDLEPEDGGA